MTEGEALSTLRSEDPQKAAEAEAILWALYCARRGFVDEVVRFEEIRRYLVAFAGSAYQNPPSICPQHQMLLPRLIRSQIVKGLERPKKGR